MQGPVPFAKTSMQSFTSKDEAKADAVANGWVEGDEPMWSPEESTTPAPDADVLVGTFRPADVSAAADYIRFAGLANGDEIRFAKSVPNNTLPSPIVEDTYYFVVNATATTFQISATPNGNLVELNNSGTGNENEIWRRG